MSMRFLLLFTVIAAALAVSAVPAQAKVNPTELRKIIESMGLCGGDKKQIEGLIDFAGVTVGKEQGNDGWTTVNHIGCRGAFQFCPRTYKDMFGSYFDGTWPTPEEQTRAWITRFMPSNWRVAVGNGIYDAAIDKYLCSQGSKTAGACAESDPGSQKITQSSIMMSCQFGCGTPGCVYAFAVTNKLKCFDYDPTKEHNGYPANGREQDGMCTGIYMMDASGIDVSCISKMAADDLNVARRSTGKPAHDPKCGEDEKGDFVRLPSARCNYSKDSVPPPRCADLNLLGGMTLAAHAYQTAAITLGRQMYDKMKVTNLSGCIKSIRVHFDKIKTLLLSTIGQIAAIIMTVLNELMSAVCSYVLNAIENVLNLACIPTPSLGYSFSMPSLTQNSCDGVSLADFISINGYGGSFPSGMPTLSIQGMSLGDRLYWPDY